jgi:hypothetical protein
MTNVMCIRCFVEFTMFINKYVRYDCNQLQVFFINFFQFFRLVLFAFSVSLVIGFPNVEDHHADETGILRQESGTGQPESHHDSRKPSSSGSVEPYMDDDGRICQVKRFFWSFLTKPP